MNDPQFDFPAPDPDPWGLEEFDRAHAARIAATHRQSQTNDSILAFGTLLIALILFFSAVGLVAFL